jgi:hypothetical protein
MLFKRNPGKGEKKCPYDGIKYSKIPGYTWHGCPICKSVGPWHLPVPDNTDDKNDDNE